MGYRPHTTQAMTTSKYNEILNSFIGSNKAVYELPSSWSSFIVEKSKDKLTSEQIDEIKWFLRIEASQFGARRLSYFSSITPPASRGKSITCFVFKIIS